jgi:hypothetical protein
MHQVIGGKVGFNVPSDDALKHLHDQKFQILSIWHIP